MSEREIDTRNPMWANILSTYKCLIDACEKMPGTKLEDAFTSDALQMIKDEYEWLKKELDAMECPKCNKR